MTIKEAQNIYREAWAQHCLGTDPDVRKAMQVTMDHVQPYCCASGKPDDEWYEFTLTLPGYREHWADLKERCNEMALEKLGLMAFAKPS